jgi:hypothetical protein
MTETAQLRCRQIAETDFTALAALLQKGFCWPQGFWLDALAHMRDRATPDGYPRYGYLLESGGQVVGAILTIFSATGEGEARRVRCNVSSWYVEPAFRGHGSPMISRIFKYKEVTVLNTSPVKATWPILAHQGYRRYSEGQFACLPALKPGAGRVRPYAEADASRMRDGEEAALMAYHAARGCLALVCEAGGGLEPFVLIKRRIERLRLSYVQLGYCRDTADFVRLAGPVGRWLLARGYLFAMVDAEGPVAGLTGVFLKDRQPKYYRGPERPRLNDLAYTEAAVLGV